MSRREKLTSDNTDKRDEVGSRLVVAGQTATDIRVYAQAARCTGVSLDTSATPGQVVKDSAGNEYLVSTGFTGYELSTKDPSAFSKFWQKVDEIKRQPAL